jgi:hypothetical protein
LTSTRGRFGCRGQGPADGEKVTAPSVCAGADRGNSLNQTEEIQTEAQFLRSHVCPATGTCAQLTQTTYMEEEMNLNRFWTANILMIRFRRGNLVNVAFGRRMHR